MGHAARSREIIRQLGAARVIAVTEVDGDIFRPLPALAFRRDRFDAGCIQPDGLTVDADATLREARRIAARNRERLDAEVAWLAGAGIRLVVCDVPSFPLRAARAAQIPAVLVANFTWVEIYRAMGGDLAQIAAPLEEEYRQAAVVYRPGLALPLPWAPDAIDCPIVVQEGGRARDLLAARARPDDRLAFVYTGLWPAGISWDALGRIDGWTFFTYDRIPAGPRNVVRLDEGRPSQGDVARSVDVIVAKPGYGVLGTAMAHAIPILLVPREGFAETPALVAAAESWGGARRMDPTDFAAGSWRAYLEDLPRPGSAPRADGAAWIAADLARRFGV